jgi:hypothetical protein
MAMSMMEKTALKTDHSTWPDAIAKEFERERANPNPCVGSRLLSENERVRVWEIRLQPGERIGFHRHVLDYFWTAVSGGAGASMCMTAPPSNIPTSPARPGTRPTAPASSRSTILKISATGRWCS